MSKKNKRKKYEVTDAELTMHGIPDNSESAVKKQSKTSVGWLVNVWSAFKAPFSKVWIPLWTQLRKFVSVPFLIMLFLAFSLWYAIKLGYTYQAEVPFEVVVDGHEFKVKCMVEGQGARLFARRLYGNNEIILDWGDLDVSTSAANPGAVVISPYSLQNAISAQSTDIKVLSVGPVPEIVL